MKSILRICVMTLFAGAVAAQTPNSAAESSRRAVQVWKELKY